MRLQNIPSHPKPKVGLEQYTTPSIIASDLIWNAFGLGDIENRGIVDLGCGTGIFAIGSALMGANSSIGVDIDESSIVMAREASRKLNLDNADFIVSDICEFNDGSNADTVFQNPPFGSQKRADKGQDIRFVKKAIELNPDVLYSFHMASTEEFLVKFYEDNCLDITHIFRYEFPIPKIYEFHNKEKRIVDVIVIRAML